MDRQPYVSGNKPFLPRTSAPSVLRLSIFLRHPQEERHTKAREKREREVISAPNLKHPWVLLSPQAVGEEWRHAHLHTSGNLELLSLPRGHIVLKTRDSVKNPSWVCLERSLYKKPLVHQSTNEFSCPSSLSDKLRRMPCPHQVFSVTTSYHKKLMGKSVYTAWFQRQNYLPSASLFTLL